MAFARKLCKFEVNVLMLLNNKCMSYPAMPKELAVAAVTVLSFFLVGGGGGGGAMLRATVLILTLFSIVWLMLICPIPLTAMALTVRITEKKDT